MSSSLRRMLILITAEKQDDLRGNSTVFEGSWGPILWQKNRCFSPPFFLPITTSPPLLNPSVHLRPSAV